MKNIKRTLLAIFILAFTSPAAFSEQKERLPEVVNNIDQRIQQLPNTVIDYDRSLLNENETKIVQKLIEASRYIDEIFWRQVSEKNPEWRKQLQEYARSSEPHKKALHYFYLMKGPWDQLAEQESFVKLEGAKEQHPAGAGFYPPDMTKEEFEKAAKGADKEKLEHLFTVVRRQNGKLVAVAYSEYYKDFLQPAAKLLREAAAMTQNASLKKYLELRADAFASNDYYQSDLAWMDLDSDIEVVIGPYEVYLDELFNYKAAFESFLTVVDKKESESLKIYTEHLPDMEKNLPIPDEHKNPNRGTESPIKVVQEIFTAGDARSGVQTAAFNLPNDERVREAKGSKKVLLKNVMEAKFKQSGKPIATRVLAEDQAAKVSFDAYFNHTLFHELAHGLGPGIIAGPDGKKVEARILLKNLYSTIEEAKADVLGVWNLFYAMDKKLLTAFDRETLMITDAGLFFRGMRFGIDEAHGQGTAIQWNWYREKGAIIPDKDGRYRVVFDKMEEAVKSLSNELLMIEALGDFQRAQKLIDNYGKSTPEIQMMISKLQDIPVDIAPVFTAAGEK